MKLAEKRATRYIKVMTCNNIGEPLGVGLWEGVPLREVIWLTRPIENIRRLYYHGYHNDDPKQLFQSSLAIGRVLEDPPGELPVMLCYKLNGQWLSGKRGGPVRMLVPEAYGFKSVKWLQRIVLTNNHQANDTYADGNNDIESPMKTFGRFINAPQKSKSGERLPLVGMAQVGVSGLSKVQVWLHRQDAEWPADDPYFASAPWRDAEILPPPAKWGGDLSDGKLPELPLHFDPSTGKPRQWPMRYAVAHWATLLDMAAPGKYFLSCRTIDANGNAQPMPRPFAKSGRNAIQRVSLTVET
jgi:DMSO/TMAO reductase YedYZ molybdopterin-dependent catalytic subunit